MTSNQVKVTQTTETLTITDVVNNVEVVEMVTSVIEIGSVSLPPTQILSGLIAPLFSIGRTGDFYINTITSEFYGPKDSTLGWGSPITYIGSSELPMSIPGTLTFGVGVQPFLATRTLKIVRCRAACATAPTGLPILFDINKNGTTIFTTQGNRPSIGIGLTIGTATVPDVITLSAGDILTIDVDQVGSIVPGANATLVMELV